MNTMSEQEMARTEGGFTPVIAALIWISGAVVGAALTTMAENWPDFKKGVMEGYNGVIASN